MSKPQDSDTTTFDIKGSGLGAGAWFGILFFGAFIAVLLLLAQAFQRNPSLVPSLVAIGAAVILGFLLHRARSKTYRFAVSPDAVRVDDKDYNKADISELLIRNGAGATYQQVTVDNGTVIYGTGLTGAAMVGARALGNASRQIGAATGLAVQQSMAKNGNAVCIRHGRKVIALAKYQREDDAVALFKKVAETM
jgi:hypothetical protein